MDLLNALTTFIRVVETGSLSAVAREKSISQSAVTREIGGLEEHFGVRLLHRTTRRLSLTNDGEILLPHARHLVSDADAMEGILNHHRASPVGLVRVGVFVPSGLFLTRRLPRLLQRYPGLKVDVIIRDRFGDLIDEQLDVAFHRGDIPDSSLVSRQLGVFGDRVVAAPAYVEAHGTPQQPTDLVQHVCILRHDVPDPGIWRFDGPQGPMEIHVDGPLRTNNSQAAQLAVRDGHAIAMLPEILVADDLRTGRLVALLPDYPSQRVPVHLVYPSRRNLPPRTRLVIDFIVEETRAAALALARNCAAPAIGL